MRRYSFTIIENFDGNKKGYNTLVFSVGNVLFTTFDYWDKMTSSDAVDTGELR